MARSVNKVILIGNVGQEPEVKTLENGTKVASFSMATSETYKDKQGELVTNTDWHNVVIWRKLAEIVEQWVKRGSKIYIEGKLKNRSYEDKDGNKRYRTDIVADQLVMLGGNESQSEPNTQPKTGNSSTEDDDDLPF